MLDIKILLCGLITVAAGCAAISGSQTTEAYEESSLECDQAADFEDSEILNDIFIQLYGIVSDEISAAMERPSDEAELLEINSIVTSAIDLYLQGYTIEAINLIYKAEEMMERRN